MSQIKSELLRKINSVIKKYNMELSGGYSFKVMNLMLHEDRIEIEIGYTRKFFEISEYVASAVEQSNCDIDSGECEKLFEKLYNKEIDRINKEYAINIDAKLEFNDIVIEFHKLLCNCDICDVGLIVNISMPLYDAVSVVQIVRQVLVTVLQIILLYDATLPPIL